MNKKEKKLIITLTIFLLAVGSLIFREYIEVTYTCIIIAYILVVLYFNLDSTKHSIEPKEELEGWEFKLNKLHEEIIDNHLQIAKELPRLVDILKEHVEDVE